MRHAARIEALSDEQRYEFADGGVDQGLPVLIVRLPEIPRSEVPNRATLPGPSFLLKRRNYLQKRNVRRHRAALLHDAPSSSTPCAGPVSAWSYGHRVIRGDHRNIAVARRRRKIGEQQLEAVDEQTVRGYSGGLLDESGL